MSASKNDEGAAAPPRDAAPTSQDQKYVSSSRGTMTEHQLGVNNCPAILPTAVTPSGTRMSLEQRLALAETLLHRSPLTGGAA